MDVSYSSKSSLNDDLKNENFEKFYIECNNNVARCKYKKVYNDITSYEPYLNENAQFWRIKTLKLKTILKLIKKKRFNPEIRTSKPAEYWIAALEEEFDSMYEFIFAADRTETNMLAYLSYLLEFIYTLSVKLYQDGKVKESLNLLACGDRFIKMHVESLEDPSVLRLCTKILLFLSAYCIADSDYETARIYQKNAITLEFRAMLIRCKGEDDLDVTVMNKAELSETYNSVLFLVIGFYQRGVVEESINNLEAATDCFFQAKWFSAKFFGKNHHFDKFAEFLSKCDSSLNEYCDLHSQLELFAAKTKKQPITKVKKSKSKIAAQAESKKLKLNSTQEYLKEFEFPEIEFEDDKESCQRARKVLFTVRYINKILSPSFNEELFDRSKLNIAKLDEETVEMFLKKVQEANKERFYKEEQAKASKGNLTSRSQKQSELGVSHSHWMVSTESASRRQVVTARNKPKKAIKIKKQNKYAVSPYKYNKFVFSKTYINKRKHLDSQLGRELHFQKQMLQLKKNEKLPIFEKFDRETTRREVKGKFDKVLNQKKQIALKHKENLNNQDIYLKDDEKKFNKKLQDLQLRISKSLETGLLDEYDKLMEDKPETMLLREEGRKRNNRFPGIDHINKVNRKANDYVEENLKLLQEEEEENLISLGIKKPKKVTKTLVFKAKNMDHFVVRDRVQRHHGHRTTFKEII